MVWRLFISQSDCADVQPQKEQTEQKSREKLSVAKLSMTAISFHISIVVHRFKFDSFIIILLIIKMELSKDGNNKNSNFLI